VSHRDGVIPVFAVPHMAGQVQSLESARIAREQTMYALVHPHLQSGNPIDIQSNVLEDLIHSWLGAIKNEIDIVNGSMFALIGASMGGFLANRLAGAAHDCACPPQLVVLLDPCPPIWHKQELFSADLHTLALHLLGELGELDVPNDILLGMTLGMGDAEFGIVVAQQLATARSKKFSVELLIYVQRTMRVLQHFFTMINAQRPQDHCINNHDVFLVLANLRADFFDSNSFTAEESGAENARKYGDILYELEVPGGHHEVIRECYRGVVNEFNTVLDRLLQMSCDMEFVLATNG